MVVNCCSCGKFINGKDIETGLATRELVEITNDGQKVWDNTCAGCLGLGTDSGNSTGKISARKAGKVLAKYEFRAWLQAKPTTAVVGEARDSGNCPLANFFKQAKDMLSAVVREPEIVLVPRTRDPHMEFVPPRWAADFTHELDKLEGLVSAALALKILDAVDVVNVNYKA